MFLKLSIINILKWIFAIILAGLITLGGAAMIMHGKKSLNYSEIEGFNFYLMSVVIPAIGFCGFVILTSVFVPFKKRNAAILVLVISTVFILLGAQHHYADDGHLANKYIIRYASFLIAITAGYLYSYMRYRKNKWSS